MIHFVYEGVQNSPPQDMPLWNMDYFELKAIERPCGLKKNFYLFVTEFKLEALLIITVVTRSNFL